MRQKFLVFLIGLAKLKEGDVMPMWLSVLMDALHPIKWLVARYSIVKWDYYRDILYIEGVAYSGDFFRSMARNVPIGQPFVITERTVAKDGSVSLAIAPFKNPEYQDHFKD